MKGLFFWFLLLIVVGCARVQLGLYNDGAGPIKDFKIVLGSQILHYGSLGHAQAVTKTIKITEDSSPRFEYLKADGGKVWASAALELKAGDRGKVTLVRVTKKGSEEFKVYDKRPQTKKKNR